MKKYLITLLIAAISIISFTANAAEAPQQATVLQLSATARQTVTPDTLVATLNIEAKGKSPETVQNEVNAAMQRAVEMADKDKKIKAITGSYHVYERWIHPKSSLEQKRKVWQANQKLTLKGRDHAAVLKLAGKMQGAGFAMQGLSYTLSKQVSTSFEETLMAQALQTIKSRANAFAKQLGKSKVHLAQVNFNSNGYHPQPMMMRSHAKMEAFGGAMEDSMAAPVSRPGETELSASVNAEVWLED